MSDYEQAIKFTHNDNTIGLHCRPIADGLLVEFQDDSVTRNRIVTDEDITKYIGSDIYCAFNYAAKQLNEPVNVTDFNFNIICSDIPQEQIKSALSRISNLVPPGTRVIDTWRRIKSVLSECSVLISEYDWNQHSGTTSAHIVQNSENVRSYINNCLNEISDNSVSIPYRKASRHLKNQLESFSDLLSEGKYITCYGVIPPKCENCNNACDNLDDDITWGPALFWFLVVVMVILLIWLWFSFLR